MKLVFDKLACKDFLAQYTAVGRDWYEGVGLSNGRELVAAVLYTDLTECNVQMHVAGVGRWAIPMFLTAAFRYPFVQLGLARVTGLVDACNAKALRFNEHLGFVREGVIREGSLNGDVVVMGMLKSECVWLGSKEVNGGQEKAIDARAA